MSQILRIQKTDGQIVKMSREPWNRHRTHHDLANHVAVHCRVFADALPVEVSVLTSVYNTSARHIREFRQSLGSQTSRAWELVLVDDG